MIRKLGSTFRSNFVPVLPDAHRFGGESTHFPVIRPRAAALLPPHEPL